MSSSGKVLVPIILIVSVLCTIGVIYGGLEMSDSQRSAFDVLKDLISGELTLKDIWDALIGKGGGDSCTGPDVNGVYALDSAGYCVKKGCKPGYFEQGGICLKQQDLSEDIYDGEGSVDCQLDPDNPYIYGQCKHPSSGVVLTPYTGNCGIGIKTKTPNPKYVQVGLTGTCGEETLEECTIECPEVCTAPPSLWAPIDGAQCRAIVDGKSVVLGEVDAVTGFGHCGEGGIVNTFSQDNITGNDQGAMNLEEYKNSINFSLCEEEKGGNCNIACTDNLIDIGCQSPTDSWDWILAMGGAIYKRESAQKVLNREIAIGDAELMPGVTRSDAADLGVLDEDETEVLDITKMPKGVQIWFKAGETNSYQNLTANKCSIVELRDAEAPRISTPCEITDVDGACASVGCGQNYVKWRVPTVTKMAWGTGTCTPGSSVPINCLQQEANCCDEKFVGAWVEETGYDGCVQDVDGDYRRKYTRTGNYNAAGESLCSESNEKLDELCHYDCRIESIDLEDYAGTTLNDRNNQYTFLSTGLKCFYRYRYFSKTATGDFRDPKGTGKACPDLTPSGSTGKYPVNFFRNTADVNTVLDGTEKAPDFEVPVFQCETFEKKNNSSTLYFQPSTNCAGAMPDYRCGSATIAWTHPDY
jgi:hypothetical protein